MTRTRHIAAAIALTAMVLCCIAPADDGALRVLGGAVAPMDEHPDVSMDQCIVNADIYVTGTTVRCRFVLTNHGPDQTVLMGFPARGGFGDSWSKGYSPRLEDFHTSVDGTEIATELKPGVQEDGRPAKTWYTKQVHFRREQTRVVRAEYTQPHGATLNRPGFGYSLETGASWKRSIGDLQITLEWCEDWDWCPADIIRPDWRVRFSEDGRRVSFRAQNIEPERGFGLSFWPCATGGSAGLTYGQSVDMWAESFAEATGAKKHWDPASRTVRFDRWDGSVITVREGSRRATVDLVGLPMKEVTLPRPVRRMDLQHWSLPGGPDNLLIPANEILDACGFTVSVVTEHDAMHAAPKLSVRIQME